MARKRGEKAPNRFCLNISDTRAQHLANPEFCLVNGLLCLMRRPRENFLNVSQSGYIVSQKPYFVLRDIMVKKKQSFDY